MDSDDDSFSFKPLGGSLHTRPTKSNTTAAASTSNVTGTNPTRSAYQSADDIANKYMKKAAAAAAPAVVEAEPTPSPTTSAPKFGMIRPSTSPPRAAAVPSASPTAIRQPLIPSELDDSIESIDPGTKASPIRQQKQQPGGKAIANQDDTSFTDSPFQPKQPVQKAVAPSVSQTRHSYVDPKHTGRAQREPTEEEQEEESAFAKQIKPLGGTLWNKHVETRPEAPSKQRSSPSPVAPSEEERKDNIKLEPFSIHPSPTSSAMDQSRQYAQLLEKWEADQAEIKHLRAEKTLRDKQQRESAGVFPSDPNPPATSPDANPLQYFSASTSDRPLNPPLPPALQASQFDLDSIGQLQLRHTEAEKQSLVNAAALVHDSHYTGDVRMDEVLADHKRLRQRLRAAQHAIEALAASSEPGGVDISLGQALRGGSVTNPVSGSPVRSRSSYHPAIQSPNALSLSQYAHLPPARAVLKLLNRLEREEESYLADRARWKQERASLLHQIQTLYTDLKHLTALSHQAQLSEQYHRSRESEQEDALNKLKADREAERARWIEVEHTLRENALRERVRFNAEVTKLERHDQHYKEKYDAVMIVLRKYESERNAGALTSKDTTTALAQQQKLFDVLTRDFENERSAMLATLAKQEEKFKALQAFVALSEKQKDALLREQRSDIEREIQRRLTSEQQLAQMQQNVTKSLDEKLTQLNSYVSGENTDQQSAVEHAAAEIANQYARAQHEPPLYERRRTAMDRTQRRGSAAFSSRYADSADESGRSTLRRHASPPARSRSSSERRRALQAHVSSAQQILSLLPPNSNVRGEIELVLPPSDSDDSAGYDRQQPGRGRPRYARPTYSSRQAAEMAQHLYHPSNTTAASSSRCVSRSRSAHSRERERELSQREWELEQRERELEAKESGRRVRQEADRRVQFSDSNDEYVPIPPTVRRARSASRLTSSNANPNSTCSNRASVDGTAASSRVGPAVNGHQGVTIRVMKQHIPPSTTKLSSGTQHQATKKMVRLAYNAAFDNYQYDRYGRISEARYV
jgi:hypothetical protein